jgi:hypothetical protein
LDTSERSGHTHTHTQEIRQKVISTVQQNTSMVLQLDKNQAYALL